MSACLNVFLSTSQHVSMSACHPVCLLAYKLVLPCLQWLQIDFGELVQVTKVATQGQQDGNHWVTKFTLSYSMDGIHWAKYKENSVTWVSDNHQLLHSWTKLMRQFYLIFFNFCPTGASPQNRKE